jgi:hypothetical protein
MFSNSTRFTHESHVSTKPWPMPPCHARDLSRAFWLARTQTPWIICLHRWILLDRTVILIPFDSTCSSGCDFIYIHKLHVKFKKCLKYNKRYLKCVRKSNPWYNGDCVPWNFFMRPNDEVTGHWSFNWHVSFWKPWSFMWDSSVWKEQSSKPVPNFTKKFPRGRESTPRAHNDFDEVWTPSEFPVIKIPTRPTPVAAPRGRNVWNFSPFLRQWMKTRKATQKWLVHLLC